ncbi:MAG: tetratricopeptide repeat protein [Polyangiales bacterium]
MSREQKRPPGEEPPAEGQVIHVDFARGHRAASDNLRRVPVTDRAPDLDTVARTFPRAEVTELFALGPRQLASWERLGIVAPTGLSGRSRVYTFADLIAVRAAKGLLQAGFPTAQIRKAIEALRAHLPDLSQPLLEARLGSDGAQMLARHAGVTFDPVTGQRIFDFNVRAIRDDVVRVLRPKISRRQQDAWEAYLEGLRLDEDETTRPRAEAAYRRAVELDPSLATALTNLGNLRLLDGDRIEAEQLYRRAIAADGTLAEAPYNLAYLLVERGEHALAVESFRRAVELRADFAEAHFNLAMALSELGRRVEARVHWKRYLELEPQGAWAASARQHLDG